MEYNVNNEIKRQGPSIYDVGEKICNEIIEIFVKYDMNYCECEIIIDHILKDKLSCQKVQSPSD